MKTTFYTLLLLIVCSNALSQNNKMNDQQIADAVEDQFLFDHAVIPNRIDITVTNGQVELIGNVDNVQARDRATRLAQMVKGVKTVTNNIVVSPMPPVTDEKVRENVQQALFLDPATDVYQLKVKVKDGVVTLNGEVESFREKMLAADVAKTARGVVKLKNNVNVNFKTDRPDSEIEYEVEQALKWNVWVQDGLVDVKVKGGKVILTGSVGSALEKNNAAMVARVAGVKEVDDSGLKVNWDLKNDDLRANKNVKTADKEIKDAIVRAAVNDPRVKAFNITPEVENGEVTLRGNVDNLKAKTAAENLALNTLGVKKVENRLKVRGEKVVADKTIENNINAALSLNAVTEAWDIIPVVYNGNVTLTGTVDSHIEKEEAEWVASGVPGVGSVHNLLSVNYPYAYYWHESYPYYTWHYPTSSNALSAPLINDAGIKDEVKDELWWSPFVDSEEVSVSVNNGHVTLKGEVDSWLEYKKATENAWEGGAWSVDNQIKVNGYN